MLLRPLVHLLLHELDRSENIGHFNSPGNRIIERQGPPPANTKADSFCAYAGRFAATDILRNLLFSSSSERTYDLVSGRGFLTPDCICWLNILCDILRPYRSVFLSEGDIRMPARLNSPSSKYRRSAPLATDSKLWQLSKLAGHLLLSLGWRLRFTLSLSTTT